MYQRRSFGAELARLELPAWFVRKFQPIRTHTRQPGIAGFVFDDLGVQGFRLNATGHAIPDLAIWELIAPAGEVPTLQPAATIEIGSRYIVTNLPADSVHHESVPLRRRLTVRERARRVALEEALERLSSGGTHELHSWLMGSLTGLGASHHSLQA